MDLKEKLKSVKIPRPKILSNNSASSNSGGGSSSSSSYNTSNGNGHRTSGHLNVMPSSGNMPNQQPQLPEPEADYWTNESDSTSSTSNHSSSSGANNTNATTNSTATKITSQLRDFKL